MADADPDAAMTSRKRAWDNNDALHAAERRERIAREAPEVRVFEAQTEHFNAMIQRAGSRAYILELLQEDFDLVSGVLLRMWPKTDAVEWSKSLDTRLFEWLRAFVVSNEWTVDTELTPDELANDTRKRERDAQVATPQLHHGGGAAPESLRSWGYHTEDHPTYRGCAAIDDDEGCVSSTAQPAAQSSVQSSAQSDAVDSRRADAVKLLRKCASEYKPQATSAAGQPPGHWDEPSKETWRELEETLAGYVGMHAAKADLRKYLKAAYFHKQYPETL